MRTRILYSIAICLLVVAGCGKAGPALTIGEVQIVAPAPGRSASVAYFTVYNGGAADTLTGVSSSGFESVEMHETVVENDIAKMAALDAVSIDAKSELRFEPGGKHLMLMNPTSAPLPGKLVTLNFSFASGALLIVDAPVQTRIEIER